MFEHLKNRLRFAALTLENVSMVTISIVVVVLATILFALAVVASVLIPG